MGVTTTIPCCRTAPIEERIRKGRKTLNAASGLGIKRNGLTMATCNLIFWNVVIPTTLYGCELWVLDQTDIDKLELFQRQAGRRIQRFASNSPTFSCFYGLGWMDICSFICARKPIFMHTMIMQPDGSLIKTIMQKRTRVFNDNIRLHIQDKHRSPIFEILKISFNFGLYECLVRQIFGRHFLSKNEWKTIVWGKTWDVEENHWVRMMIVHKRCDLLYKTTEKPRYLNWWYLADLIPCMMRTCEDMAKIVCGSSKLKCDVFKSRQDTFNNRVLSCVTKGQNRM